MLCDGLRYCQGIRRVRMKDDRDAFNQWHESCDCQSEGMKQGQGCHDGVFVAHVEHI